MCSPSAGVGGQGASASENTAKKGIKLLQCTSGLRSCQTIPVKALFWLRPEQETVGECKEKCIQRAGRLRGKNDSRSCALLNPVGKAPGCDELE